MAAGEGPEVVFYMERLDEIHILAGNQLEHISYETGSDVSLRYQHADIFIEPLRIETGAAACGLESRPVNVIVHETVDVVVPGHVADGQCRLHAADELVIFDIFHHLVL